MKMIHPLIESNQVTILKMLKNSQLVNENSPNKINNNRDLLDVFGRKESLLMLKQESSKAFQSKIN